MPTDQPTNNQQPLGSKASTSPSTPVKPPRRGPQSKERTETRWLKTRGQQKTEAGRPNKEVKATTRLRFRFYLAALAGFERFGSIDRRAFIYRGLPSSDRYSNGLGVVGEARNSSVTAGSSATTLDTRRLLNQPTKSCLAGSCSSK